VRIEVEGRALFPLSIPQLAPYRAVRPGSAGDMVDSSESGKLLVYAPATANIPGGILDRFLEGRLTALRPRIEGKEPGSQEPGG
jgi:hypothetical protein